MLNRIPCNVVSGEFFNQYIVLKSFKAKLIAYIVNIVVILDEKIYAWCYLQMYVAGFKEISVIEIL